MIKIKNVDMRYPPVERSDCEAALARINRDGKLSVGQKAILRGLGNWFSENASGPTIKEIASLAGVSHGLVHAYLPTFEALGYVRLNRRRNGALLPRGIILMVDVDELLGEEA